MMVSHGKAYLWSVFWIELKIGETLKKWRSTISKTPHSHQNFRSLILMEPINIHLLWAHKTGTGGSRIRPAGLGGPWNWPWARAMYRAPNMTFHSMFIWSETKILFRSYIIWIGSLILLVIQILSKNRTACVLLYITK
jgi:hypothetical protein